MTRALRVADVDSHGEWLTVAVGPDVERSYREVTGWRAAEPPCGLAAVVARRAYTRGRPMPPGGVLRQITQTNLGPPPTNGRYEVRVSADIGGERSGRRRIIVDTDVRTADGAPVARVGFLLDWPAGAE